MISPDPATGPRIVAIVSHEIKQGRVDEAAARIRGNGGRMAAREGFVSRVLLRSSAKDHVLTTVTTWLDRASYEGWLEYNEQVAPARSGDSPYAQPPSTEVYEMFDGGTDE